MFDFLLENDTLSAIAAFVLVLIPAVFIHELGHFLAAKAVGITVLEFGIGLPPRMVKLFTWRGTDYTLNWLPLGGFVRPLGEDIVRPVGGEAVEQDRSEAQARGIAKTKSVNEAKPLERIVFMAAGSFFNFVMAFVLFVIIAMTGIPQVVGARANLLYVDPASPLAAGGLRSGDVIQTIEGENFASGEALVQRLYERQGQSVALTVLRADEPAPLTLTVTPEFSSADATTQFHPLILGIADGSPAQESGMLPGDLVTTFNGDPVTRVEDLQQRTREQLGQEVTLGLLREGEPIEVTLVPRENPPANQGAMGIEIGAGAFAPGVGLTFFDGEQRVLVPQTLGAAAQYSLGRIGEVLSTIAAIPGEIIRGTATEEDVRLTSPLGISQVGAIFLQESIQQNQPTIILEFIALISIALGLTNLLPIPALDGGRILFVLVEIVRGRPISPEREGMVHLVGLVLLLSLMVVVLLNDIANPLTDMLR